MMKSGDCIPPQILTEIYGSRGKPLSIAEGCIRAWLSFLMPSAWEWWRRPDILSEPLFSRVIVLAQQEVHTGITAVKTG